MNVKLTRHSEKILRERLARGPYHTPEEVIEHALEVLAENEPASTLAARRRASLPEFRAFLDALAAGSAQIPNLPSSAFTRDSIYRDHP
jgi:Arc/MetJ-type ribon-helix-helix transcriptional regulator